MKKTSTHKNNFSSETIKRLSLYLRGLRKLHIEGKEVISSRVITKLLNVTPDQFRKDLSFFGGFGKRGVGYKVNRLIKEIETILGVNKEWPIVLTGAGRLGSALLAFEGFRQFNLKITHALDCDKRKIGKTLNGVKIEDINNIDKILRNNKIRISIISTPPENAQEVASKLCACGIKGILNFSPIILRVPDDVWVSNVDMATELESIIFFTKQRNNF
ncbi:MAG: redox-sensing transcriptional repressor Rex [Candidatus Omnitrophota bacterium]